MDLHPGEQIVFEGHPSWRGAVDRAQRDAAAAPM
jgi:hypothetical protein